MQNQTQSPKVQVQLGGKFRGACVAFDHGEPSVSGLAVCRPTSHRWWWGREDEGWGKAAFICVYSAAGGNVSEGCKQLIWLQLLLACSSAQVLAITSREQRVHSWLSLGHLVLAKEMFPGGHRMERFTKETLWNSRKDAWACDVLGVQEDHRPASLWDVSLVPAPLSAW